jgi:hypothetical protein
MATLKSLQGWTVMRDGAAIPLGEPANGERLVVEVY